MSSATGKEKEKTPKVVAVRRPHELIPRMQHEFERMFDEFWHRPLFSFLAPERLWPSRVSTFRAPVLDVYEEKDDVVVKAELPGLEKNELEVALTGSTLTIKGEKKKKEETKEKDY